MEESNDRLSVLVSAYACGPNWGSEIGMGWNWIINLAKYCQLTVITEGEFKDDIQRFLDENSIDNPPNFHYLQVSPKIREICWNQGDWRFYYYYKKWQWRAYLRAKELAKNEHFDIVHQLNMIGYREPGYLWKLDLPFVWGPIGGHAMMPWRFLPTIGFKEAMFHTARNTLNKLQMHFMPRVRKAARKAAQLIAATDEDQKALSSIHRKDVVLINETGSTPSSSKHLRNRGLHNALQVCWCGKFVGRKALPLALYAVQAASKTIEIEMHIVGDGPENSNWRLLVERLGIGDLCKWYGSISHAQALEVMGNSDCLLFSSLQEGTPHVVLESLGLGTPVICHNACGMGTVIDETCGIKVPRVSPRISIEGFAEAIIRLARNPGLLKRISEGAIDKALELSWDNKAREMVHIYHQVQNTVRTRHTNGQ